jgi:hypothetical protein
MTKEDAQKVVDLMGMMHRLVGCAKTGCIKVDIKQSQDEIHRLANEVRKAGGIPAVK